VGQKGYRLAGPHCPGYHNLSHHLKNRTMKIYLLISIVSYILGGLTCWCWISAKESRTISKHWKEFEKNKLPHL
jgi:hypothetical protein